MNRKRSRFSVSLALVTVFSSGVLTYACGGNAEQTQFTPTAGTTGNGGSGGGDKATGGATSKGGATASGGSGWSTGGSSASGGSGGGPTAQRCQLPAESGNCNAAFPSYFHNSETGVCEPFLYGGCGGNDNRFSSEAECQAACSGGTPNFDACESSNDCAVKTSGCCGACGREDKHSLVAINRKHLSDYDNVRGCGLISCAPCPPLDDMDMDQTLQYFTAACVNRQCQVVDIRETELTDCSKPEDCKLRNGAGCCEACSAQGLVAVNVNADFTPYCSEQVACPACIPQRPDGYVAACSDNKCEVKKIAK